MATYKDIENLIRGPVAVPTKVTKTLLIKAIKKKDILKVSALVDLGEDIREPDAQGDTPLIMAIKLGEVYDHKTMSGKSPQEYSTDPTSDLDLVKLLISKGADIERRTNSGETPLIIAMKIKRMDIARFLVEKGANPDANSTGIFWVSRFMKIFRITPLILAIKAGSKEMVEVLLDSGADADKTDNEGSSPLLFALYEKNDFMTRLLIRYGATINMINEKGEGPLYYAIKYENNKDIIELLIHEGGNVNQADEDGTSPLMCNVNNESSYVKFNVDINKYILHHPDQMCMIPDAKEIAKMLIDAGADLEQELLATGYSCLMLALDRENKDMAKFLIQMGSHPNHYSHNGLAPLMIVDGDQVLGKMLLNYGANPNMENWRGFTPLMFEIEYFCLKLYKRYFTKHANMDMIRLLVDHEADVNHLDVYGNTALIFAINFCNKSLKHDYLCDEENVTKKMIDLLNFLIANEAVVNQCNNLGETALSFVLNGKFKLMVHPSDSKPLSFQEQGIPLDTNSCEFFYLSNNIRNMDDEDLIKHFKYHNTKAYECQVQALTILLQSGAVATRRQVDEILRIASILSFIFPFTFDNLIAKLGKNKTFQSYIKACIDFRIEHSLEQTIPICKSKHNILNHIDGPYFTLMTAIYPTVGAHLDFPCYSSASLFELAQESQFNLKLVDYKMEVKNFSKDPISLKLQCVIKLQPRLSQVPFYILTEWVDDVYIAEEFGPYLR